MHLFFLALLASFSAMSSTWSDLEEGKSYKLTQNFQLSQLERSRSILDFSKGESYRLKEIWPLAAPGLFLTVYLFEYKNCPGTDMETDLEIIGVAGSRPQVQVGAKVGDCELNIFIENKDLSGKSLFE
jgi:hypothetical protein